MITANMYGLEQSKNTTLDVAFRQTTDGKGWHNGVQFQAGNRDAEFQLVGTWELMSYLNERDRPRGRAIYLQQEPPEVYCPSWQSLMAFELVVTPFEISRFPLGRQYLDVPPLGWMYGVGVDMVPGSGHVFAPDNFLTLEQMYRMPPPEKTKLCSCIVSTKAGTEGHARRLEVMNELKEAMGDRIDFFGFGHTPIRDKREALDPYKYTVVMENSVYQRYHTEKLFDAFLGYTIPIYHGGSSFFYTDTSRLSDTFRSTDIQKDLDDLRAGGSRATILKDVQDALASGKADDEHVKRLMVSTRHRVLTEYNVFSRLANILHRIR